MLAVISFYSGDKPLAVNLANWILQLGGVSNHDCLLVVDKSTTPIGVVDPLRKAFKSVTITSAEPVGEQGAWGNGTTNAEAPNEAWLTASAYVYHKLNCRWFWLETDAVPTRSTWLDEIEAEDKRGGKPFMGAFVNIPPHEPHMSGIAVYPPNVPDHSLKMATPGTTAWDYAGRGDTVGKGKAHFTTLIQHEYRIHGESPNFPTQESLSVIKPGTAVFHRCKNDSLIARLREKQIVDAPSVTNVQEKFETALSEVRNGQTLGSVLRERIADLEKQVGVAQQIISELTAKLNCKERLAPALAAATPTKKKRTLTPEHKAKLRASMAKARAAKALL